MTIFIGYDTVRRIKLTLRIIRDTLLLGLFVFSLASALAFLTALGGA